MEIIIERWCHRPETATTTTNDINNTKIRSGKMDIKTFAQSKDGLEQWNSLLKRGFPIQREI